MQNAITKLPNNKSQLRDVIAYLCDAYLANGGTITTKR